MKDYSECVLEKAYKLIKDYACGDRNAKNTILCIHEVTSCYIKYQEALTAKNQFKEDIAALKFEIVELEGQERKLLNDETTYLDALDKLLK